jgi:hypothetical protein
MSADLALRAVFGAECGELLADGVDLEVVGHESPVNGSGTSLCQISPNRSASSLTHSL